MERLLEDDRTGIVIIVIKQGSLGQPVCKIFLLFDSRIIWKMTVNQAGWKSETNPDKG